MALPLRGGFDDELVGVNIFKPIFNMPPEYCEDDYYENSRYKMTIYEKSILVFGLDDSDNS